MFCEIGSGCISGSIANNPKPYSRGYQCCGPSVPQPTRNENFTSPVMVMVLGFGFRI